MHPGEDSPLSRSISLMGFMKYFAARDRSLISDSLIA